MKKLIAIVGPTGVGKTKLSVELASKIDGEVINADSTQVYKNLNIATAKVTYDEMKGINHHLFDIKDINENYTVYDYQKDCRKKIDEILKKGKVPILVGGTGLYLKAALYNYEFNLEETKQEEYANLTTEQLYNMLKSVDPNTNIHPNNRKRIIRSINYYNNNNKPMSNKHTTDELLYNVIFIGLTTSREILYDRINKRVDIMVCDGLIEEAKQLYDVNIKSKAVLTPIGYKELFEYFDGNISLDEALDLIKKRSRNYAKRQYTWFNNKMKINWFDVDFENFNNTIDEVLNFISKFNYNIKK